MRRIAKTDERQVAALRLNASEMLLLLLLTMRGGRAPAAELAAEYRTWRLNHGDVTWDALDRWRAQNWLRLRVGVNAFKANGCRAVAIGEG